MHRKEFERKTSEGDKQKKKEVSLSIAQKEWLDDIVPNWNLRKDSVKVNVIEHARKTKNAAAFNRVILCLSCLVFVGST